MIARVCNTKTLAALAASADAHEFNRRVTDEFVAQLDPDAVHVVLLQLAFHNEQDHHRCVVLAKMIGSDEPTTVWLDMKVSDYERLSTAAQFNAMANAALSKS